MMGDLRSKLGTIVPLLSGKVVDLLMPLSCVVCGGEGKYVCDGCEAGLVRLRKPYCRLCADPGAAGLCPRCAETSPAFDGIKAPYMMRGPVKEAVYRLKYRNLRASAPELGRLMAAHFEAAGIRADVLIPVPLHRRRERVRGYNQSELLAREISRRTGVSMASELLRRVRDTPPQVSMSNEAERRGNIEGAFECTGDVAGLRVVVVDDVVTTGGTMAACAAPLSEAGAASVWGLALAR